MGRRRKDYFDGGTGSIFPTPARWQAPSADVGDWDYAELEQDDLAVVASRRLCFAWRMSRVEHPLLAEVVVPLEHALNRVAKRSKITPQDSWPLRAVVRDNGDKPKLYIDLTPRPQYRNARDYESERAQRKRIQKIIDRVHRMAERGHTAEEISEVLGQNIVYVRHHMAGRPAL